MLGEKEEDDPGTDIDLKKVRFTSLIPDEMNFDDDFFTLKFDPTIVSIWFNEDKSFSEKYQSAQVTSTTVFDEVWWQSGVKATHEQVIEFPEFDPDVKNWYCYFTLHPDNRWTATFEGTK